MLRLRTLGELRLLNDAGETVAGPRKAVVLLAYLARRAPRPVARAELAALFWGEREEARARHSLRQSLLELKHLVPEGLSVRRDEVQLADGVVELDLATVEADLSAERRASAVGRATGDFLAGLEDLGGEAYVQWLHEERAALRSQLEWALERLVSDAGRRGDWSEAARWADRWSALSPLDERPHTAWIDALEHEGRTGEAFACHARLVARLRQETGMDPSPEFVALGASIDRIARVRSAQAPGPGSAAFFTPELTGREDILGELRAAWSAVQNGAAAVVVIEGAPGVGKSRVCEEFLAQVLATRAPHLVLRARADAKAWSTARSLLSGLRDAPGLSGAPDRALAELSRLVPTLRSRFPALPQPRGRDHALRRALAQVLEDVAAEAPVLLFVDDVFVADPESRHLLLALARQPLPCGVLLLLTAGRLNGTREYDGLRRTAALRRLRLRSLDVLDVERMIGSMLASTPADRASLAGRLHQETGGNPFLITEIIAALVEAGRLAPVPDGSWRLDDASSALPLPVAALEAIGRQIDRLSEPSRLALAAAARAGGGIETLQIAAAAGLSPEAAGTAFDELLELGILRTSGSVGIDFVHPFMRRAVLAKLGGVPVTAAQAARGPATSRPRRRMAAVALAVLALVASTTLLFGPPWGGPAPVRADREGASASPVAQGFYEEGLRAFHQGTLPTAQRLFRSAIAEDSSFALAMFYALDTERLLLKAPDSALELRLQRLVEGLPVRERFVIRTRLAIGANDPVALSLTAQLVEEYPDHAEGHFLRGAALRSTGRFLEAVPSFRRAIEVDSAGLAERSPRCPGCEAFAGIVASYILADSAATAQRIAEEWVRLQPSSGIAWQSLGNTYELQSRDDEALAAFRRAADHRPGNVYIPIMPALLALRAGRFDAADRLLRDQARAGSLPQQLNALWYLVISLRMQGRFHEALATARDFARLHGGPETPRKPEPILALGQVLFEMGRLDEAERLFASLLHFRRTDVHDQPPSMLARQRTWALTHVAAARAAAGDTGSLAALADSIETIGAQSLFGRDNRLHHHARGLLLAASGQTAEAADAFRRAIYSRAASYTRTNLELAKVLLTLNRPLDAIDILQPAFRGSLEASNLYVTHTELHATLGRAWDAAGRTDSAAVHYRWVVQALRSADPPLHARRDRMRARLLAIERGEGD